MEYRVAQRLQPGKGSVFEFTIEALEPQWRTTTRTGISESPARACQHRHRRLLTGVRILVVEDSRDIQELVTLVLTREGAEVHLASDGEEGVRMAMAGQYDVVLMDIELPLTDGRAATRLLRTQGYARPIVALTAGAMSGHGDRGPGSGFDGYVTKPVDKDELTRVVLSFDENRPGQMH